MFGAGHALELPFIFDTFDQPDFKNYFTSRDAEEAKPLSSAMMRYWTNFAQTGNPNSSGLEFWPGYRIDQKMRVYFDEKIEVKPTDNVEKCGFWREQNILLK
jgi:para-nitrobenzyl esterase